MTDSEEQWNGSRSSHFKIRETPLKNILGCLMDCMSVTVNSSMDHLKHAEKCSFSCFPRASMTLSATFIPEGSVDLQQHTSRKQHSIVFFFVYDPLAIHDQRKTKTTHTFQKAHLQQKIQPIELLNETLRLQKQTCKH